ncbi:glycosyltransferase family 4 protein [Paenibacillus marinisediminis]
MKCLVAVETRFYRASDGSVWTEAQNGASFWERYLQVFDEIVVLARVKSVSSVPEKWIRADSEKVQFHDLPYYIGPWQYARVRSRLVRETKLAITTCDCAILRVPGTIGTIAWKELKKQRKRYSLEVCSDAWEALAPGTVKSVVRPWIRLMSTWELKRQCRQAFGVSYVTERTLQRRYPARIDAVTSHYSSIEMDDGMYRARKISCKKPYKIAHVGSMETTYKAQDVLIEAVKRCVDQGLDIELQLVGDGRCRAQFEALAQQLHISERVRFLGMLHGSRQVAAQLDQCDLFVLPSLVEGLPRALIEAMARSLPCIATNVGGIPELLRDEDMVRPKDAAALADKILTVLRDPRLMQEMGERNYEKSLSYSTQALTKRRCEFYQALHRHTHQANREEIRYGT